MKKLTRMIALAALMAAFVSTSSASQQGRDCYWDGSLDSWLVAYESNAYHFEGLGWLYLADYAWEGYDWSLSGCEGEGSGWLYSWSWQSWLFIDPADEGWIYFANADRYYWIEDLYD